MMHHTCRNLHRGTFSPATNQPAIPRRLEPFWKMSASKTRRCCFGCQTGRMCQMSLQPSPVESQAAAPGTYRRVSHAMRPVQTGVHNKGLHQYAFCTEKKVANACSVIQGRLLRSAPPWRQTPTPGHAPSTTANRTTHFLMTKRREDAYFWSVHCVEVRISVSSLVTLI